MNSPVILGRYKEDFGAGSKKFRIASLNRFGSSSWGMWPVSLRTSSLALAPSFLHLHLPSVSFKCHTWNQTVQVRPAYTDLATSNAFSTGNIWSCSPHNTRTSWKMGQMLGKKIKYGMVTMRCCNMYLGSTWGRGVSWNLSLLPSVIPLISSFFSSTLSLYRYCSRVLLLLKSRGRIHAIKLSSQQ